MINHTDIPNPIVPGVYITRAGKVVLIGWRGRFYGETGPLSEAKWPFTGDNGTWYDLFGREWPDSETDTDLVGLVERHPNPDARLSEVERLFHGGAN